MKSSNIYFYDISYKGLCQPDNFERQAKKAINEINQMVGWESCTRVSLEPLSKAKHLYSVSVFTEVGGHPVLVRKQGKKISTILNKAKKAVKKIAREMMVKSVKRKRVDHRSRNVPLVLKEAS